ncbi:YheV family putative zinc ribbon protein [Candidatus Fukatsuia symbiotica]|uniref:Metal-binding protein n=1 Tax=Candidatus Fukatsuia symbiotica TaxID=1878942 RepID=A0A2U8I826_9GAMM|nr:YheV family putative zinc ribbon protein [Candidatus Fukatsuia symbiotica]AWK15253.1 hypothetical protein CCS41_13450 [Candidatus Fukatsuia symbiotica]MEA9444087.1 YheV family putative zinc ribbon protein [Candidatus Fukatsuia symbiotica]
MTIMRKRFIAGAICPQCHALDTLALWREEQKEVVECVRCGHHQYQLDTPSKATRSGEHVIGMFRPH